MNYAVSHKRIQVANSPWTQTQCWQKTGFWGGRSKGPWLAGTLHYVFFFPISFHCFLLFSLFFRRQTNSESFYFTYTVLYLHEVVHSCPLNRQASGCFPWISSDGENLKWCCWSSIMSHKAEFPKKLKERKGEVTSLSFWNCENNQSIWFSFPLFSHSGQIFLAEGGSAVTEHAMQQDRKELHGHHSPSVTCIKVLHWGCVPSQKWALSSLQVGRPLQKSCEVTWLFGLLPALGSRGESSRSLLSCMWKGGAFACAPWVWMRSRCVPDHLRKRFGEVHVQLLFHVVQRDLTAV